MPRKRIKERPEGSRKRGDVVLVRILRSTRRSFLVEGPYGTILWIARRLVRGRQVERRCWARSMVDSDRNSGQLLFPF